VQQRSCGKMIRLADTSGTAQLAKPH
jgi:hypothetical protein